MPVPRGKKSLPTTASNTELLPELCNLQAKMTARLRRDGVANLNAADRMFKVLDVVNPHLQPT